MKKAYKLLIFTIFSLIILVISITANLNNFKRDNSKIIINYPQQSYFDKQLYVEKLIQDEYYAGLIKEGFYNKIEKSISDIPGIQKAETYKLYNGKIIIDLYDRKPLAFMSLDSKFFIDEESNIIKDDKLEMQLPLVSPYTSEEDVNEIVKIILGLNKDKYLVNQVERFWVEDGQIFTNLKSFDFNIKIGNSNKLKEKIKKLKAYCVYYNQETPNLNYNQIDLTYNNQLVAIKN